MTTREFIDQWLRNHFSPDAQPVTAEEQAHFEQILVDVCEAYKQELVHTPDNEEGITAEELMHQLYGARIHSEICKDNYEQGFVEGQQKGMEEAYQQAIEKACKTYCTVCYCRQTGCGESCNDLKGFRKAMEG